ncbi:MAG: response regulator [Anaerolineae bacterium]|nr:response regulator [Anaerolineae bacterium]
MTVEDFVHSQIHPEPILVVEDEDAVRSLVLRKLARAGYTAVGAANGVDALALLREQSFGIVMSDINMPKLNGLELLQIIREAYPDVVVIMVTAYGDLDHAIAAMRLGASDYVVKPFDLEQLMAAVRQALRLRQKNLARRYIEFQSKVHPRDEANHQLLLSTVMALANSLEAKDPYTVGHSQRVADLAERVARAPGLPERDILHIRMAGLLHDIGKIGISEAVINKPGPLTPTEYAHIQAHPLISERILVPVAELNGALRMIRNHHERWDGSGYPDGLKELEIPLGARILALADAYDAMTSQRPYRPALPREVALREIERGAGRHFDPSLSRVFLEILAEEE